MKIALIAFHFKPDDTMGAVRADNWARWIGEHSELVVITREMPSANHEEANGYRVVRPPSLLTRFVEGIKARRTQARAKYVNEGSSSHATARERCLTKSG